MFRSLQRRRESLWAVRVRREHLARSLHEKLALDCDDVVKISEIACSDPGCNDIETVVLIMRDDRKTRLFRVSKPLADLTEQDLDDVAEKVWAST